MRNGLKRASAIFGCAGLVLLSGCSNCDEWMPLREGKTWRYLMKDAAEVMEVRCERPVQVGQADGWLLSGPGGESRFAWDGCVLRASKMGAMTFDPPIGILQGDKEAVSWPYTGKVTTWGEQSAATAEIAQEPADGNDRYSAAKRVTIKVKIGVNTIEVVTTFARGVGIVEQEQRNNDRTVSRAQLTNDSG